MSVSARNYREVSRGYLPKVIKKQKQNIKSYPISLFNENLADDLKKSGFFDENKKVRWWRQNICLKTFRCVSFPIFEYSDDQ